ncbi:MAG: FAD-binding oxidoreductase, partial [Polyangiales bacterium]
MTTPDSPHDLRPVEVVHRAALAPEVCLLRFRMLDGASLNYRAGQWLNFHLKLPAQGIDEVRSYSIARAPDPAQPDGFEIAVAHVAGGPASTALHQVTPVTRGTRVASFF